MDEKTKNGAIFSIVILAFYLFLIKVHILTILFLVLCILVFVYQAVFKNNLKHNYLFGKKIDEDIDKMKLERTYIFISQAFIALVYLVFVFSANSNSFSGYKPHNAELGISLIFVIDLIFAYLLYMNKEGIIKDKKEQERTFNDSLRKFFKK